MRLIFSSFLLLTMVFAACEYGGAGKDVGSAGSNAANDQVENTNRSANADKADNRDTVQIGPDGLRIKTEDGDVNVSRDGFSISSNKSDKAEDDDETKGDDLVLGGNGNKGTHPCDQRSVIVRGTSNDYEFTGVCLSLQVNGVQQKIRVDKVGRIVVNGTDNKIYYNSGLEGGEPKITINGIDNKVEKEMPAKGSSD